MHDTREQPEPGLAPVRDRCVRAFRERFGGEPAAAAMAPGRVNLIGEHTDYNGGFVLPIAIDRACVAVGAPARDEAMSRVFAVDMDEAVEVDLRTPLTASRDLARPVEGARVRVGTWASYALGVAACFQRLHAKGGSTNVDIALSSSVPSGSGLSSSASLEVAVATLLERLWQLPREPIAKAKLCRAAEHEFAGVPCGIMDQYISVMGREGHALRIDCRAETCEAVAMASPDWAVIVVMDTGVHHTLASGEYAKRRDTCQAAAAKLGVSELRDATIGVVTNGASRLSEIELRRARHVVTENARVLAAVDALRAGDLVGFGALMNASHESLREQYEVSCTELDALVTIARDVPGVFGARMTGGGFGGCAIALVRPEAARGVMRSVTERYSTMFQRPCEVFTTRAAGGARDLPIGS